MEFTGRLCQHCKMQACRVELKTAFYSAIAESWKQSRRTSGFGHTSAVRAHRFLMTAGIPAVDGPTKSAPEGEIV